MRLCAGSGRSNALVSWASPGRHRSKPHWEPPPRKSTWLTLLSASAERYSVSRCFQDGPQPVEPTSHVDCSVLSLGPKAHAVDTQAPEEEAAHANRTGRRHHALPSGSSGVSRRTSPRRRSVHSLGASARSVKALPERLEEWESFLQSRFPGRFGHEGAVAHQLRRRMVLRGSGILPTCRFSSRRCDSS